jgi:hypothetical protein
MLLLLYMTNIPCNLVRHPMTPSSIPLTLMVDIDLDSERNLHLHYRLRGTVRAIKIPPPLPSMAADGLWQHTCFEMFIGNGCYVEFNFSPSGQYAIYAFDSYRVQRHGLNYAAPCIHFQQMADGCELAALCDLNKLPFSDFRTVRLGISAVIEAADGTLSYWALRHGDGNPDFHNPEHWLLSLDPEHLTLCL